jgi:hypothetical protein
MKTLDLKQQNIFQRIAIAEGLDFSEIGYQSGSRGFEFHPARWKLLPKLRDSELEGRRKRLQRENGKELSTKLDCPFEQHENILQRFPLI